jgi:hypothetical protein
VNEGGGAGPLGGGAVAPKGRKGTQGSKTYVCGRSPAEIVGSNPTDEWVFVVSVVCCPVEVCASGVPRIFFRGWFSPGIFFSGRGFNKLS